MSGLQSFDADELHCVHCHAPAAGPCARCLAPCCGDCVELRMGWTRQQAVCRLCLARRPESPPFRAGRGLAIGGVVAAAAGLAAAWIWGAP
jgi:hypothetical protein